MSDEDFEPSIELPSFEFGCEALAVGRWRLTAEEKLRNHKLYCCQNLSVGENSEDYCAICYRASLDPSSPCYREVPDALGAKLTPAVQAAPEKPKRVLTERTRLLIKAIPAAYETTGVSHV